MFTSTGTLIYSDLPQFRLVVNIDPEIAKYYRSLLPKNIKVRLPMYKPHISVVRHETPTRLEYWKKYHGKQVSFIYNPYIFIGVTYCWLKVHSTELEDIRVELGLARHRTGVTRPPDEQPCFHTTIGNFKVQ